MHLHLHAIRRIFAGAFVFANCTMLLASDLHVDPAKGDDISDGVTKPVKTISRAISLAKPGDTIHLMESRDPRNGSVVYRDWAAFFDKSGEPGNPITLDGHGATLDGCDPLDPNGWNEANPGLFRNDDLMPLTDAIIQRWFFVMDGKLNRMNRCSKGTSERLKEPDIIQPGEWTFIKDDERTKSAPNGYIYGTFWLRLRPGQSLSDAKIEFPVRMAGVLIHGTSSHLVIKNLTATRPYNDGFNLSDCRDVVFENIQATNCGDDGISAHGACKYEVDGFISAGNATGICDTGSSETSYRHVLIRDCIGFDLFFLDTGNYRIRDSTIISTAEKSLYLQGREKPETSCRLTLDNVLIRRERTENVVRISSNCILQARGVTFLNLDLLVAGGEATFDRCKMGGQVPGLPTRKPRVILQDNARWQGKQNSYDIESFQMDERIFTRAKFNDFKKLTDSDSGSRWEASSYP